MRSPVHRASAASRATASAIDDALNHTSPLRVNYSGIDDATIPLDVIRIRVIPGCPMANPKLNAAVEAAGGPVAVAYKLHMSVANVYRWKAAGRVFDAQDAVMLARLAFEGGLRVTFEELAGLAEVNGTGPRGRKQRPMARTPVNSSCELTSVSNASENPTQQDFTPSAVRRAA